MLLDMTIVEVSARTRASTESTTNGPESVWVPVPLAENRAYV